MIKVRVYSETLHDREEIAVLSMVKGKIKIDTTYTSFKEGLIRNGIRGILGKHYTIVDGAEFLRQMPNQYHGSRLFAILEEG